MSEKSSPEALEQKIKVLENEVGAWRRACDDLKRETKKYQTLVENAMQGIFVAQDGEIKFANSTALLGAGVDSERGQGVSFIDFVHPDDRDMVMERHVKRLRGESLPSRYAFRTINGSGRMRWMELNVVQIQWEGKPATLNYLSDVTLRKQAEENLLASEENFRMMVEKSPIGILIVDDTAHIIYANEKLCMIMGYPLEEMIGEDFSVFLTEDSREIAVDFYLRRQKGEKVPDRYEISFTRKNGETGYGEVQSNIYRNAGGRSHSIVQISDISDRIKSMAERLLLENQLHQAQKMESVGRLAGGVAHDFNNMLNVILGHAELAMTLVDTDHPVRADLKEIEKSCLRSADLVQQLLAFARKQTIAPKVMDLNEKVAGTLKMLQRLVGEDKELVWKPGFDLWPVVMDPAQVDQIFANLAVNAHDAIPGVGRVSVETRNVVIDEMYCAGHTGFVPGEFVMLLVGDNGCGMDRDTLHHAFEPFFTTKEVGKGTGLGLATVYGIVKQNGGFINVYSELNEGTAFKMYFPRVAGAVPDADKALPIQAAKGGKETILMVEDDASILTIGKTMLEKLGYTVLTAEGPKKALQISKAYAGHIHLLLTDVVMPEMNGKELASRLISYLPGLKCLYMSGYTADIIAHRGVLEGGVNFIQKPFSRKELDDKIRKILDPK